MRRAIFAALFAIAVCGAVLANDSSATLGAGGLTLTQSADIRMVNEDLSISREFVRVRYEFVNESDAPIATRVAFPLPEADLERLTEADVGWPTENATNTVDFRVQVDGREVTPVLEEKAFLKGLEVTDVLRRLGVPISPRARRGPSARAAGCVGEDRACLPRAHTTVARLDTTAVDREEQLSLGTNVSDGASPFRRAHI